MIPLEIKNMAKMELARRDLWEYCKLMHPHFYKSDREYLKDLCFDMQDFLFNDDNRFMVINLPPRHGKSFTATNTVSWMFGQNPKIKVMTGSYNEILSGTFAKQIRDRIQEIKASEQIVYSDIFPNTKIKYGEASASMWALEGSNEKSYLATSPNGTATGFGGNVLLIDDLIKNDEEAYNENVLEKHWEWFTNTMLSRLEGNDWKVIIIMTRWAKNDLAGKVLNNYDGVKHITYKAHENKKMLCDSILSYDDYLLKTKEMNIDIVEANYNQEPIDIKGRLYGEFKVWEELPKSSRKYNVTDTADTGNDYLCSVSYVEHDGEIYVTDVVFTQEPMEITEQKVATMLYESGTNECEIEANNGGRGFARNVERAIKEKYNSNRVVIKTRTQRANKESRILTASAWVNNHVYMPFNWKNKYPDFYKNISGYMGKGKNLHDDGPDVLSRIYEKTTSKPTIITGDRRII